MTTETAAAETPKGITLELPRVNYRPPGGWHVVLFSIVVGGLAALLLRQMDLPPWSFPIRAGEPLPVRVVDGPLPGPNPGPIPPGPNPGPQPFPGLAEQVTAEARRVSTSDLRGEAARFAESIDRFVASGRSFSDVIDVFRQFKSYHTPNMSPEAVVAWRPFSQAMGRSLAALNLQTPDDALKALSEVSRGLKAV